MTPKSSLVRIQIRLICTACGQDLASKIPRYSVKPHRKLHDGFSVVSESPLLKSRNKELEDIKTRRATNEEILADIASAEKKKKDITSSDEPESADMLGDLR